MLLVLLDISVYLNFTVFASVIHKGFAVSWVNEQKSQKTAKRVQWNNKDPHKGNNKNKNNNKFKPFTC